MPIFFQQELNADTRLAIWKIEEEEGFFLRRVPLQREITHPHKRLQHLAGRYLLKQLFPDFPTELIRIADTRKPFLEDEAYHFSISHCLDYAAVAVSRTGRPGVDIELASPKVERIRHKFVSPEEEAVLRRCLAPQPVGAGADAGLPGKGEEFGPESQATLLWSAKEAVFKWYGLGGVDFRAHIQLKDISRAGEHFSSLVLFKKNEDRFLDLHSHFFEELCLSYVIT